MFQLIFFFFFLCLKVDILVYNFIQNLLYLTYHSKKFDITIDD